MMDVPQDYRDGFEDGTADASKYATAILTDYLWTVMFVLQTAGVAWRGEVISGMMSELFKGPFEGQFWYRHENKLDAAWRKRQNMARSEQASES